MRCLVATKSRFNKEMTPLKWPPAMSQSRPCALLSGDSVGVAVSMANGCGVEVSCLGLGSPPADSLQAEKLKTGRDISCPHPQPHLPRHHMDSVSPHGIVTVEGLKTRPRGQDARWSLPSSNHKTCAWVCVENLQSCPPVSLVSIILFRQGPEMGYRYDHQDIRLAA